MTSHELLALVLHRFLASGDWPKVREVQRELGTSLNLRVLAADIGRELLVCQEAEDGHCSLTLAGLEALKDARDELALLARAVSLAGAHYAKNGPSNIPASFFAAELDVHGLALRRLGVLLRTLNGPWSSHGADGTGDGFWVHTREDAFFYQGVSSFAELRAVQSRRNDEQIYISHHLTYRWQRPTAELRHSYLLRWPKIARQVESMRARFLTAEHEEDYQGVGHLCREILISVAEEVFDPSRHRVADGVAPSATDAKRRLDAFLEAALAGGSHDEARAHAKAAVKLADALVHKRTASYRLAALSAEATLSVVNISSILCEAADAV